MSSSLLDAKSERVGISFDFGQAGALSETREKDFHLSTSVTVAVGAISSRIPRRRSSWALSTHSHRQKARYSSPLVSSGVRADAVSRGR